MSIDEAATLLGGLTPAQFMRRHWQKKPLLVRQAMPDVQPPLDRSGLFELAARDDVESRLVRHDPASGWRLRHGPFARRALPPRSQAGWTLLVQGVDLHVEEAHALLQRFGFLPQARVDDLMISYASDGGGVGPHVDSYDVFLLQVSGRRRWRWGRQADLSLRPGLPLKILSQFEPQHDDVLEPGDMLYLPPQYAHDGVALGGDCMTCSIGLRAPAAAALGADLLLRLAENLEDALDDLPPQARALYRDPQQPATQQPGELPASLMAFARQAVEAALSQPDAIAQALGESLTEPKPQVSFEPGEPLRAGAGLALDRRTRMLYDARHVFINGESFRAGGRDARLMQRLADQRRLEPRELQRASAEATALIGDWCDAGWCHAV